MSIVILGLPCSVFHALKLIALKMVLGDQSGEHVVDTTIMVICICGSRVRFVDSYSISEDKPFRQFCIFWWTDNLLLTFV